MTVQWKIVDQHGDDVMTAEAVALWASQQRTTPRQLAQREAKLQSGPMSGEEVFAVKA